jgi:hypothetical protein
MILKFAARDSITMNDQETMALCAIRYTIGRMTYIVSDGQRWAREWGAKSPWIRGVLIRDLKEAVDQESHGLSSLGDRHDSQGWHQVLEYLEKIELDFRVSGTQMK